MLLDSGNFSDDRTPQRKVNTKRLLQAMGKLGYEVVNVGDRDILLGYDAFRQRTADSPFRFISANVVDEQTKKPVFDPHTVVELERQGVERTLKIGVTGVARYAPRFAKEGPGGSRMMIADPVAAVETQVRALEAEGVDIVIVLAALPGDTARRIAEEVPGIDYILGAYGGEHGQKDIGQTSVIFSGSRGQRIGEVRVFLGGEGEAAVENHTVRLYYLTREYPQSQEMLSFLEWLEEKDRAASASETSQKGSGADEAGTSR